MVTVERAIHLDRSSLKSAIVPVRTNPLGDAALTRLRAGDVQSCRFSEGSKKFLILLCSRPRLRNEFLRAAVLEAAREREPKVIQGNSELPNQGESHVCIPQQTHWKPKHEPNPLANS